jgi:uncharacterized protein
MANIGKRNMLRVVRDSSPGVYLDGGEHGEILLPNRYVPRRIMPGDRLEVFVYRDSQDRLVATTETPRAMVGDIARLKVLSVNQKVGAFLDWGLAKDLLLPFREQTGPVSPGREVLVRVYLDPKSDRVVATMRLEKNIEGSRQAPAPAESPAYRAGEQVEFIVTDRTDLGYKALIDGRHPGLLYHENVSVPVKIGQRMKGFVRACRPDGKVDLSLDEAGYRRVGPLALRIVQALQSGGGRLALDDNSAPEDIRNRFGASKKAYKQALGTLYKARRIRFTNPGIELLENTSWEPGSKQPGRRKGSGT